MKFLNLVSFILIFVQIINCDVNCYVKNRKNRQLLRSELNSNNSIYIVTDYGSSPYSPSNDMPLIVKFLYRSKNIHLMFFVKFNEFQDKFMVKLHSNVVSLSDANFKLSVTNVTLNLTDFIKSEKCVKNNLSARGWLLESNFSFCFLM